MPNRKHVEVQPLPGGDILIRCRKKGVELRVPRAEALALASTILEVLLGETAKELVQAE